MHAFIEGIGVLGPGLDSWSASAPILAGSQEYRPLPVRSPPNTLLPPNERRRAVPTVKLALAAGAEAFAASGRSAADTATVFTSSGGDGDTIHEILSMLASSDRVISPTRFHNSVHNTPAGYWGIATGSRAASTSLCCHDDSFVAGLLETTVQVTTGHHPTALIAYDTTYPDPLNRVRPLGPPFAVSLVLAPQSTTSTLCRIELDLREGIDAPSSMDSAVLETLRRATPAARSLPLLAALAQGIATELIFPYLSSDLNLSLKVYPQRAQAITVQDLQSGGES